MVLCYNKLYEIANAYIEETGVGQRRKGYIGVSQFSMLTVIIAMMPTDLIIEQFVFWDY